MLLSRGVTVLMSAAITITGAGIVAAQEYPNKPIRIITTSPGGGGDFATRVLAQGIAGPLGQQVVVDNRSSDIPGEVMLRAPRDGHTLLAVGSSHWLLPYLRDKAPFDPVKDYAPITLAVSSP